MNERLLGCLDRPVLQFPDKPALIDGEKTFTYREFSTRVNQLAAGLASRGISKGDAVAALCLNHHHYLEIYFACHTLGAVVVPLNIRLAGEEIVYILNDSQTCLLFIDEPFLPLLPTIQSGVPGLREVVYSDTIGETPAGLSTFEALLEGQSGIFDPPASEEDDVAGYFYTGGTTGHPKGVMLTQRNIVSNAFHLQTMLNFTPADRWLHIAPMFHLADVAAIYAVMMMGGTHVFGRAFDPKLFLEIVQRDKVTSTILVPTMLNFVLNAPDFDKYDLSSMRFYLYGASPMPVPLLKRAMEMMPCGPVQGYGMTEAAPLVTVLTAEQHRRGISDPGSEWILSTAGCPVPGVDVRIVGADGQEVAIGEAGEITLRGPNVMKGYLNKPEATAEAIRDGWYHSGDVAVRNAEGFVTIVDRMKDMIISGGENIYTTEVESVIMRHEAVLETTVIGVPDDKWGEVVKAFVVLKPNASATEQELLEFTRGILAHFKCPRSVDFLEELPKSGAGKILKRDLRAQFWGEGRQVN